MFKKMPFSYTYIKKKSPYRGRGIYRGRRETPFPHPPPAWSLRSLALSPLLRNPGYMPVVSSPPPARLNSFSCEQNQIMSNELNKLHKKVWKSEFNQELLSYLNNNRRMLGIIRKIVKFSVK